MKRTHFVAGLIFSAVTLTSMAHGAATATLEVTPAKALSDTPLHIVVRHLDPDTRVEVNAVMQARSSEWASSAVYVAGDDGTIDLTRTAPISGDYSGVDGMGLIWSMRQMKRAPSSAESTELDPSTIAFSVLSGGHSVAGRTVTRLHVLPGVTHAPASGKDWNGVLYRPAGSSPQAPALIVLGGAEGGRYDAQAALLASHGYAVLALAYFGEAGLPPRLAEIPLESVKSGIDWLLAQPGMAPNRVGIVGTSKGGELALLAASTFHEIAVVVGYSAPTYVGFGLSFGANGKQTAPVSSWTYKGQPLPFIAQSAIAMRAGGEAAIDLDHVPATTAIAVEKIRGPVMLIAGADDGLGYAGPYARKAFQRLEAHHHAYADQLLIFPAAGHLLDAPYHPTTGEHDADTPYGRLVFGGTAAGNAHADAESWPRVLALLHQTLDGSR